MNESLSFWALIANASTLVQVVMLLLVVASFISWVIIFSKSLEVTQGGRSFALFEQTFWSGHDLRQLYQEIVSDEKLGTHGVENVFVAGFQEFASLTDEEIAGSEAILENAKRNMRVALSREEDRLSAKLPFLATVGSTSPYVGLFGTVWGIMNAFRSLAGVSQVSLSSVAPGISEALIATAMGLLAAIPAVIAYNRLGDRVDRLMNHHQVFTEEFTGILYRRVYGQGAFKPRRYDERIEK